MQRPLQNKIALVAGATRGAGRGIATMLGEAGATVYCTGRSSRNTGLASGDHRPETIEETAERVTAAGGTGIAVRTDHSDEQQVQALMDRIRNDHGRLDILVNDVWGGDSLMSWGKKFWEEDHHQGFKMLQQAIHTHILTSKYALPLMLPQQAGLIIEITDGDGFFYRGHLYYDLVKTSLIRLAFGMAEELESRNITALAVTPGFLRSEMMLEIFGVTEENWRDGAKKDPNFIASETPYFVGRAIAALAADAHVHKKTGRVYSSWDLSDEYGFTDIDGNRPHWGNHVRDVATTYQYKRCDDEFYSYWRFLSGVKIGDTASWS
ncbi:SDR family oxidoreductase [Chitinophaga lutea]